MSGREDSGDGPAVLVPVAARGEVVEGSVAHGLLK